MFCFTLGRHPPSTSETASSHRSSQKMRISVFSIRNVLFYPGGDTPLRLLRPHRAIVHHENAYFGVFYKKCFVLPWGRHPPSTSETASSHRSSQKMRISVFSIRNVLFYPGGDTPLRLLRPHRAIIHRENAYFGAF